jgi:hypothetical protein
MRSWSSSSLNLNSSIDFIWILCVCFFFLFFFLILSFDAFIFWKMIIFYLLEKRWNKNIKNSLSTLLPPHYQKSNSFNYLIINYYHNNHLMLQSCPQCVFAFLISCACVCLSPCRRVFCLFFVDLFFFNVFGECRCSSCSSVLYSRDFSFCFLFFGLMCGGKGLFYVRGCGFYCICHALRLSWTKKWKKNTVKQYTRSSSIYLTFVLHSIIFNLVSFAISGGGGEHVNLPLAWRMM